MSVEYDKSIEAYLRLGAEFRLFKSLEARIREDLGKITAPRYAVSLTRARHKYDQICSKMEDEMFYKHPELNDEYVQVFYGDVGNSPYDFRDRKMLELAKQIAIELFGENWERLNNEQNR